MKLSEAIALGSAVTQQAFGLLINDERDRACALGAAYVALGLNRMARFEPVYPWTYEQIWRPCPECRYCCHGAIGAIMHLNDCHEWTRERIADWVKTIEPPEPEAVAIQGSGDGGESERSSEYDSGFTSRGRSGCSARVS